MKRILVANRGEIAQNAIRCIREMGLETVAVCSEVDANSLHIRYADKVVSLPGAHPSHNYASVERILDAARTSGADAIYTGYGFLSESARFARACQEAGITFIGPDADTLTRCANKTDCLSEAASAGIPVPEHSRPIEDESDLESMGRELGYPLVLKPVTGTGGQRIEKIYKTEELIQAYRLLKQERDNEGGRSPFYLERYVRKGVHVEFPILADSHGTLLHLGDRESVVLRRWQKVVSECPSSLLPEASRESMIRAALEMARRMGFRGCGSVEFMVEPNGKWHFLEINPRIPVEYTLTELVWGVELIKEQIRIAAGQRLTLAQESLKPRFHAVEVRVAAEDPEEDFRPSAGVIREYYLPGGYGYSALSSVQKGQAVEIYYDPTILKVNCFGDSRETALAKLSYALSSIRIKGVRTNIPFLRRIVESKEFLQGEIRTDFKVKDYLATRSRDKERQQVAAIVAVLDHEVLGRFRTPSAFAKEAPEVNVWSRAGLVDLMGRRSM